MKIFRLSTEQNLEAEIINHDLTLQFGDLAWSCKDDNYLHLQGIPSTSSKINFSLFKRHV